MKNQAHSLEMLMERNRQKRIVNFKNSISSKQNIIAISSGKGGVGKSTFVTNLSIMLAQLKKKVLVMDADLGLANLHILFNQKKKHDLSHVFKEDLSLKEIITPTPYGVDIIFGGNGLSHLLDLSEAEIWLFLDQIKKFHEYDFIFFDVGAGASKNILSFLRAANYIIILTTPEPTSLTDAYGLIKAYLFFNKQHYIEDNFFVVVNKSVSFFESQKAIERLDQTCKRYLNLSIKHLGYLPNDENLVNSVYQRQPLVSSCPNHRYTKLITSIGNNLIQKILSVQEIKKEKTSV